METLPILVPRREQLSRDPQRAERPHSGDRGRREHPADRRPHDHGSGILHRCQDQEQPVRDRRPDLYLHRSGQFDRRAQGHAIAGDAQVQRQCDGTICFPDRAGRIPSAIGDRTSQRRQRGYPRRDRNPARHDQGIDDRRFCARVRLEPLQLRDIPAECLRRARSIVALLQLRPVQRPRPDIGEPAADDRGAT